MAKFKYGDRVRCVHDDMNECVVGKIGTVVEVRTGTVGVAFDECIRGHSMSGRCRQGCGWYLANKDVELVRNHEFKVLITFQDKNTTAKMLSGKRTIIEATARCSDKDVFDPLVGAQIALQRLAEQRGSKFVVNSKMFNDVEVI